MPVAASVYGVIIIAQVLRTVLFAQLMPEVVSRGIRKEELNVAR